MQDKKNTEVEGILWGEATIANVKWGGVRLRDLFQHASISTGSAGAEDLHVCFASHVTACEEDDWFGASIPLEKALASDGDVLLAYEVRPRRS